MTLIYISFDSEDITSVIQQRTDLGILVQGTARNLFDLYGQQTSFYDRDGPAERSPDTFTWTWAGRGGSDWVSLEGSGFTYEAAEFFDPTSRWQPVTGTITELTSGVSVTFRPGDASMSISDIRWDAVDLWNLLGNTLDISNAQTTVAGLLSQDDILVDAHDTRGIHMGYEFSIWSQITSSITVLGSQLRADVIVTGDGNDFIFAFGGDDSVLARDGDDRIRGFSGDDTLWAGDGDDTASGDDGNDVVGGGAGDDSLRGGDGDDALWGDDGYDLMYGDDGQDSLGGGNGNDTLLGGDGADQLWGALGNDSVEGGSDHDVLAGGTGNDTLFGDDGHDTLYGGAGADSLEGGEGADELWGGNGNDYLRGGDGDDQIYGGVGNDTLRSSSGNDALWAGDGDDTLWGGAGDDILSGGAGNDSIYDSGPSQGFGAGSHDTVYAGAGDDLIGAGDGDDVIFGGEGNDTLFGETGADDFMFNERLGMDEVRDFSQAEGDRILLDQEIWQPVHGILALPEVMTLFGSVTNGVGLLDFQDGNTIEIQGLTNLAELEAALTLV